MADFYKAKSSYKFITTFDWKAVSGDKKKSEEQLVDDELQPLH